MSDKQLIELMDNLSKRNKLDNVIVQIISDVFIVDASKLCKDYGITYFLILPSHK